MRKLATGFWSGLLSLFLMGCSGEGEAPQKGSTVTNVSQEQASIPAGRYLYCITNLGYTMTVYDLERRMLLPQTRRRVALDPVGPWFLGKSGFYLSRVAFDGTGKNSLFEFDPTTLEEKRRLDFPPNSNPTTLALLPTTSLGWVALKGSTFDDFASNGIVTVDLAKFQQVAYFNLSQWSQEKTGERLTSVEQLLYDASKQRLYALVSNWYFQFRQGALLVLKVNAQGELEGLERVNLGLNPVGAMLLEEKKGVLWVANNGGYVEFGGQAGTVQALATERLGDQIPDNETLITLPLSNNPTGIYALNEEVAWVMTYPQETIQALDLKERRFVTESVPKLTGPLFRTSEGELLAGMGAFGRAKLARLDTTGLALLEEYDLQAGNGGVSCAEHRQL